MDVGASGTILSRPDPVVKERQIRCIMYVLFSSQYQ